MKNKVVGKTARVPKPAIVNAQVVARPESAFDEVVALIQSARGALLPAGDIALTGLLFYAAASTIFAAFALFAFNWMRPRFADVV